MAKYLCENCYTLWDSGKAYFAKKDEKMYEIDEVHFCQICGSPEIKKLNVMEEKSIFGGI